MRIIKRLASVVFGLSLILPFATAVAAPLDEIADIFSSAAGGVIARELGLSSETRALLSSRHRILANGDVEELARSLESIRSRYLRERPGDESVFQAESVALDSAQDALLKQSIQGEREAGAGGIEFARVSTRLEDFRSEADDFVSGGGVGPEVPRELPALHGKISISVNKDRAQKLFELARNEFMSNFDARKLREILVPLKKGRLSMLSPEDRLVLKKRRKEASIIRNSYLSFDESHEVPTALHAYARDFGHLNDAIENGLPDLVARYARELDASLDPDAIERALSKFSPSRRGSFEKHLRGVLSDIDEKTSHKTLPTEQFHDLRKELKELMNILSFSARLDPDPAIKAGYDFLYELNEQIGLIHDDVVARSMRGEVVYDDQKIKVPRRYRDAIKEFLKSVD